MTTVTSVPYNQTITLRWTVTNGACSAQDDVTIRNDEQPVVSAGPDQVACEQSSFTMAATSSVGTDRKSVVEAKGTAVITRPTSATTTVTSVPYNQTITIRWTGTKRE